MTANLKKLSDSLRSDTPEKGLERSIHLRRSEIDAALSRGSAFEIRDSSGRIVKISPRNGRDDR